MHLEISLCDQDYHHLEKFAEAIETNAPVRHRINKCNGKEYKSCRLVINSTKMCYDLINLGCTPKKTFTIKFPTSDIVPSEYVKYWIEGFFDGDGCICVSTMNDKPHIEVTFTGIESMLNSISTYLFDNEITTQIPKLHIDKRGSKACSIYYYGNNVKWFLDYIYGDAPVYLDRKYEKYKEHYKDYKKIDINGVSWSKYNKAYIVSVSINNNKIRVGQSKNLDEAIAMRKRAEIDKFKTAHSISDN